MLDLFWEFYIPCCSHSEKQNKKIKFLFWIISVFRRDSLAQEKGLHGVLAEANGRSGPRQPSSSGVRPGQAARPGARRILGESSRSFWWRPLWKRRAASPLGCPVPSCHRGQLSTVTQRRQSAECGRNKDGPLRRGGGRTGDPAASPGSKVGLSSPWSFSDQSGPANALTWGVVGRAEDAFSRSNPTLRGCFAVPYRAKRKESQLKSPLGVGGSKETMVHPRLQRKNGWTPRSLLRSFHMSPSIGFFPEYRIWHSLDIFPLLLPSLLSFYGPRGGGERERRLVSF